MGDRGRTDGLAEARAHVAALAFALEAVERELPHIEAWGAHLAGVLASGGRMLAVGNGGSAAHAAHLASELVGKYKDERRPLSGLALATEGAALTAIGNDYGGAEVFARQVAAHGRPGDVLVALSTSGSSPNVLAAVERARGIGMTTWALTGAAPNPLSEACDDVVCAASKVVGTIQEVHQVVVHLLCAAVDRALPSA